MLLLRASYAGQEHGEVTETPQESQSQHEEPCRAYNQIGHTQHRAKTCIRSAAPATAAGLCLRACHAGQEQWEVRESPQGSQAPFHALLASPGAPPKAGQGSAVRKAPNSSGPHPSQLQAASVKVGHSHVSAVFCHR